MVERRNARKAGSKTTRSRKKEPQEEVEAEEGEEETSASGGSARRKTRPRPGGARKQKQKVNPLTVVMLIGTPLLIILAIIIFNLENVVEEDEVLDAGKIWKEANKIGNKGLTLYQKGQLLKQQGKVEESAKTLKEGYDLLTKAIEKGSDALYNTLCINLNLNIETSGSWIKKFTAEDRFETFDEFLIENNVIKSTPETKAIIDKWKKGTGGFEEKMGNWSSKKYDINKNLKLKR